MTDIFDEIRSEVRGVSQDVAKPSAQPDIFDAIRSEARSVPPPPSRSVLNELRAELGMQPVVPGTAKLPPTPVLRPIQETQVESLRKLREMMQSGGVPDIPRLKSSDIKPMLKSGLIQGVVRPVESFLNLMGNYGYEAPVSKEAQVAQESQMSEAARKPQTFGQELAKASFESLPSQIPLLAGGVAAKGIGMGAKGVKTALAIMEGAQSGESTFDSVRDEIRKAPFEALEKHPSWQKYMAETSPMLPPEERMAAAREKMANDRALVAGLVAGAATTGVSKLTGGGAIGQMLEPDVTKRRLVRAIMAPTSEGIQETGQSYGESIAGGVGAAPARPGQTLEDVLGQAEKEAAVGGASGALLGLLGAPGAAIPRQRIPAPATAAMPEPVVPSAPSNIIQPPPAPTPPSESEVVATEPQGPTLDDARAFGASIADLGLSDDEKAALTALYMEEPKAAAAIVEQARAEMAQGDVVPEPVPTPEPVPPPPPVVEPAPPVPAPTPAPISEPVALPVEPPPAAQPPVPQGEVAPPAPTPSTTPTTPTPQEAKDAATQGRVERVQEYPRTDDVVQGEGKDRAQQEPEQVQGPRDGRRDSDAEGEGVGETVPTAPVPAVPPKLAAIAAKEKARKAGKAEPAKPVETAPVTEEAELAELQELMTRRAQPKGKLSKKDEARFAQLFSKHRSRFVSTVKPESDELLGVNERGENIYWNKDAKTHYAMVGGRVQTAPWIEGLPDAAINRLNELLGSKAEPAPAASDKQAKTPELMTPEERTGRKAFATAHRPQRITLGAGVTEADIAPLVAVMDNAPKWVKKLLARTGFMELRFVNGPLNDDASLRELQQFVTDGKDIPWSVMGVRFPSQGIIGVRTDGPHPDITVLHELGHMAGMTESQIRTWEKDFQSGYVREGDRYVFKPAAQEAAATPTKAEPPEPAIGSTATDSKGNTFIVSNYRYGMVTAHPVIDGKPVVNRDSAVRFAVTSMAQQRNPEARRDLTLTPAAAPSKAEALKQSTQAKAKGKKADTTDSKGRTPAQLDKLKKMAQATRQAQEPVTAATPAIKTTTDAKGDVTVSVPSKDKPGLPPKEQKKYLLAEIDKAIEVASDDTVTPAATVGRNLAIRNREIAKENKDKFGVVTIEVPDDGEYEILNNKETLQAFKSRVSSQFPVSKSKPSSIIVNDVSATQNEIVSAMLKHESIMQQFRKQLDAGAYDDVFAQRVKNAIERVTGVAYQEPTATPRAESITPPAPARPQPSQPASEVQATDKLKKFSRITQEGIQTDDNAEGSRESIPDGQAELWRSRLDSVRDGGTRYDQERLAEVEVDEAAASDPAFREARKVARQHGIELVPVTNTDFGGVIIGDTILVSTDPKWGGYKKTLAHEVFHQRVSAGDQAALAEVQAARSDDAAMVAYMDRLDREAPNWYQEMHADAQRRLGASASSDAIADDIANQIAEEIASDKAMERPIPEPVGKGSQVQRKAQRLPAMGSAVTHEQDAAYMDAVNRGDMATAQRMVDEAARRAGYNVGPIYHGTADLFTEFDLNHPNRKDTGWLGTGVYATSDRLLAESYSRLKEGSSYPRTLSLFAKLSNPYRATLREKQRIQLISHAKGKEEGRKASDEWTRTLKEQGHDGVMLKYKAEDVGEKNASTEYVVFDTKSVKSADPITRDDSGNVIPLSQRFNERSPDIRYQRLPPSPPPPSTPTAKDKRIAALRQAIADLRKQHAAKLKAMSRLERLKYQTQLQQRIAEFRKGTPTAKTPSALATAAEVAGEREEAGARKIIDAAAQFRAKSITSGRLARLDAVRDALAETLDWVSALTNPEDRADEIRKELRTRLFDDPTSDAAKIIDATYRPQRLLDRMIKAVETRIRGEKQPDIKAAIERYYRPSGAEQSKAYKDLTDDGKAAMDRWLESARTVAGDLDSVPVMNDNEIEVTSGDEIVKAGTKEVVGKLDPVTGMPVMSDAEYIGLDDLYDNLKAIEELSPEQQKQRTEYIKTKGTTDASLLRDDATTAFKQEDPDQELARVMETQEPKSERLTGWRGKATKWRSIFNKHIGRDSHIWSLVEALRKGDSAAKGVAAKAREQLDAFLRSEGISQEDEYRMQRDLVTITIPVQNQKKEGPLKPNSGFGTRKVGFTKAQLISIWNTMRDPASRRILNRVGLNLKGLEGGEYTIKGPDRRTTRAIMDSIERQIAKDAQLVRIANKMQDLVVEAGSDANKVSQYFYGRDEFTNDRYWPRSVAKSPKASTEDDATKRARGSVDETLKNMSLSRRRVAHGRPLVIDNGFKIFDDHVGDVGRYTHLTIPANELLNAFTTGIKRPGENAASTFIDDFAKARGKEYRDYIMGGLERIMAGEVTHLSNQSYRTLQKIGQRASGSTLAGSMNAWAMNRVGGAINMEAHARQYGGSTQEQRDAVARDFARMASLPQNLSGPEVEALMKSGFLRDRWLGRAIRLALGGGDFSPSNYAFFRKMDRLTEKFNSLLVKAEMANSVALYKALIKNGVPSDQAVDIVELANRDTQNSTSELDKSSRGSDLQQALSSWFPFISQGLVQTDFFLDTIAQARREGWKATDPRLRSIMVASTLNVVMLAPLLQALTRMLRKDEEDDLWRIGVDMVVSPLEQRNPLFKILDPAIQRLLNVVTGTSRAPRPTNMVESTINDASSAAEKIIKGNAEYPDYIKALSSILKITGGPAGILTSLRTLGARLMPETRGQQSRSEDQWFDRQSKKMAKDFSTLNKSMLRAQADMLFNEAVEKGYITPKYSKAAFASRFASRYEKAGGVISDKKAEPSTEAE